MTRPAGALFFGAQATPEVCAVIEDLLSIPMRKSVETDPEKYPASAWEFLRAVETSARAFSDRRSALVATSRRPLSTVRVEDVETISVSVAAKRLGVTRQAVHDRIARGTLDGPKNDRGHRRISVDQLPGVTS